jgi:hypothetical protein
MKKRQILATLNLVEYCVIVMTYMLYLLANDKTAFIILILPGIYELIKTTLLFNEDLDIPMKEKKW